MDDGAELTAHAVRDWARLGGSSTCSIEPGSPWQNPYVASFNSLLRDELLNQQQFDSLLEAPVLAEDWRIEYNTIRPHSALSGLTPPNSTSGRTPNPNSHNNWTDQRGPLNSLVGISMFRRVCICVAK